MDRDQTLVTTVVLLVLTTSVAPYVATASPQGVPGSTGVTAAERTTAAESVVERSTALTRSTSLDRNNSSQETFSAEESPKLSSGIRRAIDETSDGPPGATRSVSGDSADDRLLVVIEAAPGRASVVVDLVRGNGGRVDLRHGQYVQAYLPIQAVTALAASPAVEYIRLPRRPEPTEFQTQAVEDLNVSRARLNGYTGENVTVALITVTGVNLESDEVDNVVATKNYSSGPLNVGPTDPAHGTATAELVQDVAPNASLVVVRIDTYLEAQAAAEWVTQNTSTDVVSMSLGWDVAGPLNGEDALSDEIKQSSQAGVSWFVSAGNAANHHWNDTWQDGDGDKFLNLTANRELVKVHVSSDGWFGASLQWDDWYNSDEDYELLVYQNESSFYDSPFTVYDYSLNAQNGTQPPVEKIYFPASSGETFYVAIYRDDATGPVEFNMFGTDYEHFHPASEHQSLTIPATAPAATTVGAVDSSDLKLEPFSSRGPTIDGRLKPDIVAPDNVSTQAYSGKFYGTSASAPLAAGGAAVLLDANSALSPQEVERTLEQTAVPITGTEPNTKTGYGLIDISAAVQSIPSSIEECRDIDTSGRYSLYGNLTPSSASCLRITASNVTLDGDGYTIDGDAGSTGLVVASPSTISNITVEDVRIQGFNTSVFVGKNVSDVTFRNVTLEARTVAGINASGSGNVTVIDSRIAGGQTGISAYNVSSLVIRGGTIVGSSEEAITAERTTTVRVNRTRVEDVGVGIDVETADSVTIRTVNVTNATAAAIELRNASGALVRNITIRDGGDVGIRAVDSNRTTIVTNAVVGANTSIVVRSSANVSLGDSRIAPAAGGVAVLLEDAYNATVRNTTVTGGAVGLNVTSSNRTTVTMLSIADAEYGIVLRDEAGNATFRNVTVRNLTRAAYDAVNESAPSVVRQLTFAGRDSPRNGTVSFRALHVSIAADASPPAPPQYMGRVGVPLNVTNTSTSEPAWAVLDVSYTPSPLINESSLRLWHIDGGSWSKVDRSNGVNASANYVSANVTSFSTVAALGDGKPVANLTSGDFDETLVNHTVSRNVTIHNDGLAPLNVTNVSIIGPDAANYTRTPTGDSFVVEPGEKQSFSVSINVSTPGWYNATFAVEHDDTDRSPSTTALNTSVVDEPRVDVSPQSLDFGGVHVGNASTLNASITNTGTDSLNISALGLSGASPAQFDVRSGTTGTVAPGATRQIEVVFEPTEVGSIGASLEISHNGTKTATPVTVELQGVGVGPIAAVAPNGVSETLPAGTTKSYTIRVTNDGNAPLQVDSVGFTANESAFSLSTHGPFTVDAGATRELTVTFDPASSGTYDATVVLAHNGTDTSSSAVQFSLTAQAAPTDGGDGQTGGGDGQTGGGDGQTGGGGQTTDSGGADVTVVPTSDGVTINVRSAGIGATLEANVSVGTAGSRSVGITSLDVSMTFAQQKFRVEITTPQPTPPASAPALSTGTPVSYFTAEAINVPPSDIDQARLTFRVDSAAIPARASPEAVVLYRYHDGAWQRLETHYLGGNRYVATTSGFSAFAVGIEPERATPTATPMPTPTATPTPIPTVTPTPTATPAATSTGDSPRTRVSPVSPVRTTETTAPGFGLALTVVALLVGAFVLRRR